MRRDDAVSALIRLAEHFSTFVKETQSLYSGRPVSGISIRTVMDRANVSIRCRDERLLVIIL